MTDNNNYTNKDFPALKNDTIIKAALGQPTEYTPVWIMRQAGRYLPEFHEVRGKNDFFTVCQTPELACELTLQPIRRYPLDAAIIFSDILVVPQCLGLEVEMKTGKGPVFPAPLVDPSEVDTRLLSNPDPKNRLAYVYKAITMTRHKLEGKVPLIGFSGAPWTLMAYMVEGEGSKTFSKAKTWLYKYPEASKKLLQKVTDVIKEYLVYQIEAGAQLVQVFDSWAGELSPEIFQEFSLPYLKQIGDHLRSKFPDFPLIVFAKGASYAIEDLSKLSYNVIGLDWTITPQEARKLAPKATFQGNMDPATLYADPAQIKDHVRKMLTAFGPSNHVANLGHGLHPDHSPTNVGVFIDSIHEISKELRK